MQITLEELKHNIIFLESLNKNPGNIINLIGGKEKYLFGHIDLSEININDKNENFPTFLCQYLSNLSEFSGCEIQPGASYTGRFYVYVSSLYNFFEPSTGMDMIIDFNIKNQTYTICTSALSHYDEILNTPYSFKEEQLHEYYKQFEDLSFKAQMRNVKSLWQQDYSILRKINDTIFYSIFAPFLWKKKIERRVEEEKEKINRDNKAIKENYDRKIKEQNYIKENIERYTKDVKNKQAAIANYFNALGYKQKGEELPKNW